MGHLSRPLLGKGHHVKVAGASATPIKGHGRVEVLYPRVLNNGFDRRETGSAGKKNNGLARLFPQKETAQWPFKPKNVSLLNRFGRACRLTKNGVGKGATRSLSNMQFDLLAL